ALTVTSNPFNINPGPVTHFELQSQPSFTTVCTPITVTVRSLDQFNGLNAGFTGTIHFSSSDPNAALPADYTFTSADNGVKTFSVVLNTAALQTVNVTQTNNATIAGAIVVNVKSDDIFNQYVTAADAGGGPDVKIIDGRTGATLHEFFAYDPAFAGG